MPSLYVTEPGATVRIRGRSLLVTDRAEDGSQVPLFEVEPNHLDGIGLVGDVHVTAEALRTCLGEGISLAWFDRRGELQGRCIPPTDRNGALRMAQYRAVTDAARSLSLARSVVRGKLGNALALLVDLQGNNPNNESLPDTIRTIKELESPLESACDLEVLRGVEGAIAAGFFGGFGAALRPGTGMVFVRRERRPPTDPVNALLSFASVLLGNRIAGMVELRGLDPALGFFHELRSGRASLALDLLEEWRTPIVERFVLRVCNLRALRPEHFGPDPEIERGVRLTRDGMKVFFVEWEKFLRRPVRGADGADVGVVQAIGRQIDALAKALSTGGEYHPFVLR